MMKQIRELLAQLKLYAQLDMAFCDKLDELETRVYKLEEEMKLARGANKSNATRIGELTLAFGSFKRGE